MRGVLLPPIIHLYPHGCKRVFLDVLLTAIGECVWVCQASTTRAISGCLENALLHPNKLSDLVERRGLPWPKKVTERRSRKACRRRYAGHIAGV
jgi:hypothetical protein